MYPSLFISHAAPSILRQDTEVQGALREWASREGRPESIVVVNAHWDTRDIQIGIPLSADEDHGSWGHTGMRQESLRRLERLSSVLTAAGRAHRHAPNSWNRNELVHSVWLPLTLLFGNIGIPTVLLSIQGAEDTAHHVRVGQILRPLRDAGTLILGSGSLTHNHHDIDPSMKQDAAKPWAAAFVKWMRERVSRGESEQLIEYRQLAPFAKISHPDQDHLLPLFVAYGAGSTPVGSVVHEGFHFGTISTAAFAFA